MSSQWSQGVMPAPEGVEPNFVNPPDQLDQNIAVHAVFLTLSTAAVAMRIYTRVHISAANLGWDDYLCMFAYLTMIAFSAVLFEAISWGVGRHMWDVPIVWLVSALKYQTFASWIYLVAATCVKLSFLFLYRRLFTLQAVAKWFVNGGIVVVLLVNLGAFFGIVFFCLPVEKAWNNSIDGQCSDPAVLAWFTGVWNMVVDIYVLVVPIPLLWGLSMRAREKARLATVFSIGIFACISSIVRLGMTSVLQSSPDATYNLSRVSQWATIEIHIGLICSCLMLLPAFLRRHLPESAKSYLRSFSFQKSKYVMSFQMKPSSWQTDSQANTLDSRHSHSSKSRVHVVKTNTFTLESSTVHNDLEKGATFSSTQVI